MYRVMRRMLINNEWVYEEETVDSPPAFRNLAPGQCQSCDTRNGGPSHFGSPRCQSGSLASGGNRSHCSCDGCY